jgi:flagellar biosynthetic protein FliR
MRHVTFLMLVPGIGGGLSGVALRYPAAIVFTFAAFRMEGVVPVPADMFTMGLQLFAEMILGAVIGMIPILIVSGAQTAGHVASGTMGLNGAQLIDPTTQASLPDLARIYSDIAILIFLLVGGHHVAVYQLAGLESTIRPGSFILSAQGMSTLIDQSAAIFHIGVMIAAPVSSAVLSVLKSESSTSLSRLASVSTCCNRLLKSRFSWLICSIVTLISSRKSATCFFS